MTSNITTAAVSSCCDPSVRNHVTDAHIYLLSMNLVLLRELFSPSGEFMSMSRDRSSRAEYTVTVVRNFPGFYGPQTVNTVFRKARYSSISGTT
jgi:hypothetical protein